ncbi:helix-turn-helix transcriptional regulator [Pradoshia sp. D12]|uniref:winged helix-turn-helix transcriptional regulator n=1 Tax=Bacillaceae TaxID=186817 RepID=UPI0011240407|nr:MULTISPECIES: helix-turn-helix domain-containing protein [Bacillaceae]QFK72785.1 helix-turn-helix transcriptional regulator [Pradoshia sp. D12]TPF71779.1 helix-turn-helix transcriptional regulator [Bacillus sp. D12]
MNQSHICPKFEKAMDILSRRWSGLIIYQLQSGPQRFCTLESSIGISGRVLSERLKELEKQGIVKREVYPETPVRIEYSLTEAGEAMKPMMQSIAKWADEWMKKDSPETDQK